MRRRRLAALLATALAVTAALACPAVARAADTQVMYRLYNQWSGEHLYTADANERDALAELGWTKEGEGWIAPTKSSAPVYRLYNPYVPAGDHHYTTDRNEYDELGKIGWHKEGIGWYSDDDKGVELYRLYNPYATTGTHHYTEDENERDALVKIGWRYEGTAWYGVDAGSSGGSNGYEYVLRSGVALLEDYTPTGDTSFKVPSSQSDLKVGDKIVLEATEENPFGAAGTVTAVTKNSDGTVSVTFKQATDPSEVFYSLEATQWDVAIDSSMAEVEGAVSGAGGVSAEDSWSPSGGAIGDGFNIKLDNNGSYVKGNFSVKPTIGYDVKWTLFGGLERCELELEGDASINAQAHVQNKNAGKDVKILEAKVPIAYGFSVDIPLYVHVSLEGDLTASVDYQMDTTVRLDDGKWVSKDNSTFTTELSAAIHMRLGGKVGAELKWLEVQLVDAAVDAGADGTAKTTVRETGLTCSDLSAYAYLGVEVGTDTNYLVKLGWTLDKDLINEKNSPLKLAWHFEDGERVPECTYGKESEVPEGPDEGKPGQGTNPGEDEPSNPVQPGDEIEGERVVKVALGAQTSAAITEDGSLWMWGSNDYGQVGDGTTIDRLIPVKVMDGVSAVSLGANHSAALKSDGTLWTWGSNYFGQLGDGLNTDMHSPICVMSDVTQVSLGWYHSAAIKKDGSLWLWGMNMYGELGNDNYSDDYLPRGSSPTKIMEGVSSVSLGNCTTAAVKSDGSLWVWGNNSVGELGIGSTLGSQSTPVKIMDNVSSASFGYGMSSAIKKDGSLWVWGDNSSGQLGDGTTISRNMPVKVLDGVVSASFTVGSASAVKEDGSLWVWGSNYNGLLGDGTTTDRHLPVKIMEGVITSANGASHTAAIKSDGSLWMWGSNQDGQLGRGDTTASIRPIQISIG